MNRRLIPNAAVALVAIEHVYILVLEMFFWNKPLGMKTFNLTQEFADASQALAANQGLYNGFLAAGLFFGLFTGNRTFKLFFLACVIVARDHRAGSGAVDGQACCPELGVQASLSPKQPAGLKPAGFFVKVPA